MDLEWCEVDTADSKRRLVAIEKGLAKVYRNCAISCALNLTDIKFFYGKNYTQMEDVGDPPENLTEREAQLYLEAQYELMKP